MDGAPLDRLERLEAVAKLGHFFASTLFEFVFFNVHVY